MSTSSPSSYLLFLAGTLMGGACTGPEAAPSALGTVQLALSSAELGEATRLELSFTTPGAAAPTIADAFDVASGMSVVSRNYRLPIGSYLIDARALDAAGAPLLRGQSLVDVQPGANAATIPLVPVGEDLGDVLIGFATTRTHIAFVAADGDTREGNGGNIDLVAGLSLVNPADPRPLPELRVVAVVEALDATLLPLQRVSFELQPLPGQPLRFAGSAPADWLGLADVRIQVLEDGAPADATLKQVIGHPSPETELQIAAMADALVMNGDGTIAPIDDATAGGIGLTPEGVTRVNQAIERINQAVRNGDMTVGGDFENVAPALVYCSHGYWWCVAKVLKCELYTAGCVAAAPAATAGCGSVCVGTIGLGCVACIVAAVAGTVSVCEDAYDCWVEAEREGCL